MKEIKYIFNTVAILSCIASVVCFIASVYYNSIVNREMACLMLEMFAGMFFVAFFLGIVGVSIDD